MRGTFKKLMMLAMVPAKIAANIACKNAYGKAGQENTS